MRDLIFFVFCLLICMHSVVAQPEGAVKNRIYHGDVAHKGQFPFMGYLSWGFLEDCTYDIQCGGSIIHKRWALTANHCWLSYNSTHPVFTVGTIYKLHNATLARNKGVSREVLRFYLNNRFYFSYDYKNPETGLRNTIYTRYDHALMSFAESLEYNEFIQPIRLDYGLITKVDKVSYIGKDATIMGWGVTENKYYKVQGPWQKAKHHTPVSATALRYTDTKVVNQNHCHLDGYYHDITTDDSLNVCVSSHDQRTGCYGDSGGPVVMNYKNKLYQIGVASYVGKRGCGEGPTVYSRVDVSFDWMHDTLAYCGDNIFDPDTYGQDNIGLTFQSMPQFDPICKIQTQKEYEIVEYQREQAEKKNKTTTSTTKLTSFTASNLHGNGLLKLSHDHVDDPNPELTKKLAESSARAKERGTVVKEFIAPVEPLPFR